MRPWVILLRGVNVGGAGKLSMAEWRALLAEQGFERPETYIQSGNAIIGSDADRRSVEQLVAEGIAGRFGFRPMVLARTSEEMQVLCEGHPFKSQDPSRVHAFLLSAAGQVDAALVDAAKAADEDWVLTDGAFYLSCPSGIGRSVLAQKIDRLLPVPKTARNLRTLSALRDIVARR